MPPVRLRSPGFSRSRRHTSRSPEAGRGGDPAPGRPGAVPARTIAPARHGAPTRNGPARPVGRTAVDPVRGPRRGRPARPVGPARPGRPPRPDRRARAARPGRLDPELDPPEVPRRTEHPEAATGTAKAPART